MQIYFDLSLNFQIIQMGWGHIQNQEIFYVNSGKF